MRHVRLCWVQRQRRTGPSCRQVRAGAGLGCEEVKQERRPSFTKLVARVHGMRSVNGGENGVWSRRGHDEDLVFV